MKKLLLSLLLAFGFVSAASADSGGVAWDKFPETKVTDMVALQSGAKTFVNYCLNSMPLRTCATTACATLASRKTRSRKT